MASYSVEISRTAEKQIAALGKVDQVRVIRAIAALAAEPRPHGCRKLEGYDSTYRIRLGRFRILYDLLDRRAIVVVLKVGQRKDVYR
jgi:mRNA interferase RelE/StbE